MELILGNHKQLNFLGRTWAFKLRGTQLVNEVESLLGAKVLHQSRGQSLPTLHGADTRLISQEEIMFKMRYALGTFPPRQNSSPFITEDDIFSILK